MRWAAILVAVALSGCSGPTRGEWLARCGLDASKLYLEHAGQTYEEAVGVANLQDKYIVTCMAAHGYETSAVENATRFEASYKRTGFHLF
jgi:hypothetical protein